MLARLTPHNGLDCLMSRLFYDCLSSTDSGASSELLLSYLGGLQNRKNRPPEARLLFRSRTSQ